MLKKLVLFDGLVVRDATGKRRAEVKGEDIRENGRKITTINDVNKVIDGVGGGTLAALWVLLLT